MEEIGTVISIKDSISRVVIEKNPACAKCGMCLMGSNKNEMIAEAKNTVGAKVGQRVKVEVPSKRMLSAAFIMYIFPLICMFIGFGVGTAIARKLGLQIRENEFSIVTGFLFLFLSFFFIKIRYKEHSKAAEKYQLSITEIL